MSPRATHRGDSKAICVIGRIPFDRTVNDALMAGKTVIEYKESQAEKAIRTVWANLQTALKAVR